MIEISWSFVRDKQILGMKTMVRYLLYYYIRSFFKYSYLYFYFYRFLKRLFESSKEIKKMFGFANSLELVSDILENTMVSVHASQVIRTLDKIILSLTKSSISEHDKKKLVELGKLHYHFGLKKEYFKVINI